MKRTLLSAAGVVALATVAFSGAAQAQCWWTGLGTSCAAAPAPMYYQPYYPPYPTQSYAEYYGAPAYDYKPEWLPSYPGPKLSGGSGR